MELAERNIRPEYVGIKDVYGKEGKSQVGCVTLVLRSCNVLRMTVLGYCRTGTGRFDVVIPGEPGRTL